MTRREEKAIEYFSTALQLDVLMWSAYQELCSLGQAPLCMLCGPCTVRETQAIIATPSSAYQD